MKTYLRQLAKYRSGWAHKYPAFHRIVSRVQGGACGMCRTAQTSLYVDHNHLTGEVRGLLCHGCNIALGKYEKDPSIRSRHTGAAVQYLQDWPARKALVEVIGKLKEVVALHRAERAPL